MVGFPEISVTQFSIQIVSGRQPVGTCDYVPHIILGFISMMKFCSVCYMYCAK